MRETCTLAVLSLMNSSAPISRLVSPPASRRENVDLARRELEPLQGGIRRRLGSTSLTKLDASTASERLELLAQRLGAEFVRYRVGVADERFHIRAIATGGE